MSGLEPVSKLGERPIGDTAEQIAVEPSIGSRARRTAKERKSWPQLHKLQAEK